MDKTILASVITCVAVASGVTIYNLSGECQFVQVYDPETGYVVKQECGSEKMAISSKATIVSAWTGSRDMVLSSEKAPIADDSIWPCTCSPIVTPKEPCEELTEGKWQGATKNTTLNPGRWRGGCVRKACVEIANGNPGHSMPAACIPTVEVKVEDVKVEGVNEEVVVK